MGVSGALGRMEGVRTVAISTEGRRNKLSAALNCGANIPLTLEGQVTGEKAVW